MLRSSRSSSAANTNQRQSSICSQNGSHILSVCASQQTCVSEQGNKLMEMLTESWTEKPKMSYLSLRFAETSLPLAHFSEHSRCNLAKFCKARLLLYLRLSTFITFMEGIYNYISKTNHISTIIAVPIFCSHSLWYL